MAFIDDPPANYFWIHKAVNGCGSNEEKEKKKSESDKR